MAFCRKCGGEDGVSRRGLCSECRREIAKRSGRSGGSKVRKSWYKRPSHTAQARRAYKKGLRANAERVPKDHAVDEEISTEFVWRETQLHKFIEHLDAFGQNRGEVRYVADCVDVRIFASWAQKVTATVGLAVAFFGAVVFAHFNSLRTFGMVQSEVKIDMDWDAFKMCLQRCGEIWGNLGAKKPARAIYSANCMPGSGLPAVAGGDYLDRFSAHFRTMRDSGAFLSVVALLQRGVSSPEEADEVRAAMGALRKVVSGMLGDYHYKMLWDLTVGANWFPAHLVHTYPVCKNGGTASGLRDIFVTGGSPSPAKMSRMLDVLTSLARARAQSWVPGNDHPGSMGAALCWRKRMNTQTGSASCATRYDLTTASWEKELKQLADVGLQRWWK